MSLFRDREDAGEQLPTRLAGLADEDPVVLGLPRGGLPVACAVARALGAPLDVIVVRKLGVPFQPELGMGAVGEDGVRVLNAEIVRLALRRARRARTCRDARAGGGRSPRSPLPRGPTARSTSRGAR